MSLTGAMQTANNGLNVHTRAMNTIADNIANVSTPGFKSSSALFQDLVAGAFGTLEAGGSGQGATIGAYAQSFVQGSNLTTGSATNLAMNGDGFFITAGDFSGQNGQYYTRDGSFRTDVNGYLVTTDGLRVQGYAVDASGNTRGSMSDLRVPINGLTPPVATANMQLRGNVNNSGPTQVFDPNNPDTTSADVIGLSIYDSLGGVHNLRTYLTKQPAQAFGGTTYANVFQYNVMANPAELAPGQNADVATGTLFFDTNGHLAAITNAANPGGTAAPVANISFLDATPNQAVTINLGDPNTIAGNTGLLGLTAWDGGNIPQPLSQDGYGTGTLGSISINQQGLVSGSYSNGSIKPLAQIATARFACNDRLERIGHNLFVATYDSGLPVIGSSGANMSSGSLEQSNVDLGEEIIRALANERGFQANTRAVQVVNQMYGELIALGR